MNKFGTRLRSLQRHLWATDRPRMCYPTCQQLPWCPAHGHTGHVASPTKKPIVILAVDVKKIQTTKKTRGSDMVAIGMMQIRFRRPIQAPTGVFPGRWSAGLSARSCVTSQIHETFLRAIFCPSRASSQCFFSGAGLSTPWYYFYLHRMVLVLVRTTYSSVHCPVLFSLL